MDTFSSNIDEFLLTAVFVAASACTVIAPAALMFSAPIYQDVVARRRRRPMSIIARRRPSTRGVLGGRVLEFLGRG